MSWTTTTLGRVAEIDRRGVDPSSILAHTRYVGLEHVDPRGVVNSSETVESADLKSTKFVFTPSHVLYGKLRPYLCKIARPTFDGVCSTDILPILPGRELDAGYLYHFLRHPSQVELATKLSSGANLPRLSPKELAKFEIPIPPTKVEQKRIAAILDAADDLRTKRRESLAQLDALLQSTFLDLFGDPVTNPKGWDSATLEELVTPGDRVNYGVVQPGDDIDGGSPLIRVGDFISGELNLSNLKHIDPEIDRQYSRSKLNGTEVLISCVGSIGNICKVPIDAVGHNIARAVARVPLQTSVDRDFIVQFLRTKRVQDYFLKETRTVSQPTLNIALIKSTPILLPPLEHQRRYAEIARDAEAQWSLYRQQATKLDTLFASLQSRAFRGDL